MGVIVIASMYISHYIDNRGKNDEDSPFNHLQYARLVEALVIVIAFIFFIILWPLFLVWLFKSKWDDRYTEKIEPVKPFKVEKGDLIKEMPIEEIELFEMVNDPMNAVPELPFGHLHAVWLTFKSKIISGDKLYSFLSLYNEKWYGNYVYTGYVIVKNGKPGEFLILDRHRYLENEKSNQISINSSSREIHLH